jgi:putative FmdB family regulatory protein
MGSDAPRATRHDLGVPIYEFSCRACGSRFEELTKPQATAPCPSCGADDVERLISPVATLKIGPQGRDKRRMEARRHDRRAREAEKRRQVPPPAGA